ncbi:hypothetical protein QMK19_28930 [Streptomyces sp. H10-C2]|uniref:hypothetical protein n=1 Tax=unclassified Streptomyces TaxID=2593676 RepID=UPI0024B99C82|nr:MULTISPECIES: hypothetical protein [unclassified Streptomyces]MDJ0344235.1 hypothetical protein [Streptomyces sp. PH10-H1]MDJ0373573.1 hypothetical protein [Streptomyces sp. H10-C2]
MGFCDVGQWFPPTTGPCIAIDVIGSGLKDIGDSAFENIVKWFAEAAGQTVQAMTTAWVKIPTPDIGDEQGHALGPVAWMQTQLSWLVGFIAVLCLLLAAGRMAWERRGEPAKDAVAGLIRLSIVSGGAVSIVALLTSAGDQFSSWIIDKSTQCPNPGTGSDACASAFNAKIGAMTAFTAKTNPGMLLVIALLLLASSLIQIMLMLCRTAMLIVLAGTLPLSAAASSTPAGKAWFQKSVGWLLAFILYKPVAAIVYAAAFSSIGQTKNTDLVTQLSGVVLMILAIFTLPALMRFVTPMVEAVASAGGGGGAVISGAGQAIATGAKAVPQMRGAAVAGEAGKKAKAASGSGNPPDAPRTPPGNGQQPDPPRNPPNTSPPDQKPRQAPPDQQPHRTPPPNPPDQRMPKPSS